MKKYFVTLVKGGSLSMERPREVQMRCIIFLQAPLKNTEFGFINLHTIVGRDFPLQYLQLWSHIVSQIRPVHVVQVESIQYL